MVAISLYRGNLHRVPDVPRRWLMPNHTISLKDFRSLLYRRSVALSRNLSSPTSNPNPNLNNLSDVPNRPGPSIEKAGINDCGEGTSKGVVSEEVKIEAEEQRGLEGVEISGKYVQDSNLRMDDKPAVPEEGANHIDGGLQAKAPEDLPMLDEKLDEPVKTTDKADISNDKEKRKKEVQEKLQVLNAKKHNLVQVLKQILNAEEELKRRTSMQGTAMRPGFPLQVDVTNDSGSMTRHPTPRMGAEANQAGDTEGGEVDDASNHHIQSQRLLRMSSISPSSESPLRRPALSQLNPVSHPARASLAATVSPSRFSLQGLPGHPANPPAVSVSGTNYVASSPSPAASGGTSVFKDTRQPSPWN